MKKQPSVKSNISNEFENLDGSSRPHRRKPRSSPPIGLIVGIALWIVVLAGIGFGIYIATQPAEKPKDIAAVTNPAPKNQRPNKNPTPKDGTVKRPDDSKGKAPQGKTWVAEAEAELADACEQVAPKEPVPKPVLMTEAEHQEATMFAKFWFTDARPDNIAHGLTFGSREGRGVEAIYPLTTARYRREGLLRFLTIYKGNLDALVNTRPEYRFLLDPAVQKPILARLAWEERANLFDEFAQMTGCKESWSLTHPFDDLDGEEMRSLLAALGQVKRSGLGSLTKEQRTLILRAGAINYFTSQLDAGVKQPAPQPVPPNDRDDKAKRLQALDREAMELFKQGQKDEGFKKLTSAADGYQDKVPADCTPKEALALATIYSRILMITGKGLTEREARKFVDASILYAKRGGIMEEDVRAWFDKVSKETLNAYPTK